MNDDPFAFEMTFNVKAFEVSVCKTYGLLLKVTPAVQSNRRKNILILRK